MSERRIKAPKSAGIDPSAFFGRNLARNFLYQVWLRDLSPLLSHHHHHPLPPSHPRALTCPRALAHVVYFMSMATLLLSLLFFYRVLHNLLLEVKGWRYVEGHLLTLGVHR